MAIKNQNIEKDGYVLRLMKSIATAWEPCELQAVVNQPLPAVSFNLHPDGSVTNVSVVRTSGIIATDLACLDALLTAAPFPPISMSDNSNTLMCDFYLLKHDSSGNWAATGSHGDGDRINPSIECSAQIAIRPHTYSEPFFLVHLIPPVALVRYPNLTTPDEIHGQSNLRALKIGLAEQTIRKLRKSWSEFVHSHPNDTNKQQLDEYIKTVDQEYAVDFAHGLEGLHIRHGYYQGPNQVIQ